MAAHIAPTKPSSSDNNHNQRQLRVHAHAHMRSPGHVHHIPRSPVAISASGTATSPTHNRSRRACHADFTAATIVVMVWTADVGRCRATELLTAALHVMALSFAHRSNADLPPSSLHVVTNRPIAV